MPGRILIVFLFWSITVSAAVPSAFEVLERDNVTVTYEAGLKTAALEVLGVIPPIKKHIEERTGFPFDFPFGVVIYKDRDDFIRLSGNDMIAAFAIPEGREIVLDLSRMSTHPLNIELITMHEMTHLVLHRHIQSDHVPKWFDEGIAEWVSGISEIINHEKADVLKKATIGNTLIPFYRLRHSFPPDRERFSLSYEQSRSIIEYMEARYGANAIPGLLARLREGEQFNDAVRDELSEIFTEIEREWKRSLSIRYTWLGYLSNNIYWILFVVAALLTVVGFLRLKRRIRDYPDDENELEPF